MTYSIKRAAVLGSGVMGSAIAAHLANVGIETLMLDIVPHALTKQEEEQGFSLEDGVVRNRIANENKQALLKQKPSPITSKASLDLIKTGNLTDDIAKLKEVDWIIEVVVEKLAVKQSLFAEVEKYRRNNTIVSSNTSGISVEAMTAECSLEFRQHFLGTHFFNPPRYLKLLEVIPTRDTDPYILEFMKKFGRDRLGKGVVVAKDTPNFIANRIGTYGLLMTVEEMLKAGLSIGEVDSITGTLIGRPRSATFRTLDVVGLDTFIDVANNVYDQVDEEERTYFTIPDFMQHMLDKELLGAKRKKGFYLREKGKDGSIIYELNAQTFEYEPRKTLTTAATEMAKQARGLNAKMKALLSTKNDKAGTFIWTILKNMLLYTASKAEEIADDLVSIDEAMRWGFDWKMGPFELWDAIGLRQSVERMQGEGDVVPQWIITMLDEGKESFYKTENHHTYFYSHERYEELKTDKKQIDLKHLKNMNGVIKKNTGASLIDLGDGVAGLEFHSQSNAIGLDIIQMINYAIDEVEKNYLGLVIGNQGRHFCVGANLAMMLMEAQDDNFYELDMVIKMFQEMTMNIKYAEKPVVVAPFNMTLGGGAEVALPAASIQASAETYIGLVEFGVGLIPGGGGTKELYLKKLRGMPKGIDLDISKVAHDVFEKVATAVVSTSAAEARENGYLDQHDQISVNPAHLLYDAKEKVITLAKSGYRPPKRELIKVVGDAGYGAMLLGAQSLARSGYATEHDLKIAEKLAYVLSGGRIREGSLIDEQVMLDLEREAFLSLIGEPLTQQRMQHMLMKGKPLRN